MTEIEKSNNIHAADEQTTRGDIILAYTDKQLRDLLRTAYNHAATSADPSTQNAALLVDDRWLGLGGSLTPLGAVNGFPEGVAVSAERLERPLKYKYTVHAECRLCFKAARLGISMVRLDMVCPWAACPQCAQAIIEVGIKRLITHQLAYERSPARWKSDIDLASGMLTEAGVEALVVNGEIGGTPELRFDGVLWRP